ncbi:MAG: bifunctional [glutamate--ammonia ligase]-adenylyl-L-tyrosine phosphorylase/[glutamate--ammonia-ligase] adenylyltransferase [Desulfuromonadia bacterium]
MLTPSGFTTRFRQILSLPETSPDPLIPFLKELGFSFEARSATNIRLLLSVLSPEDLSPLVLASLTSPLPDMAINNLERIARLLPLSDLVTVAHRTGRRTQLMNILGSSPFLSNILFREPSLFHDLFGSRGLWSARSESGMLEALRETIPPSCDLPTLMTLLRRFKYREIFRIAARDLGGVAPLEEVTAELSSLASAALTVSCEVTRRILVEEHGPPMLRGGDHPAEAELVVIGMGKFGGRELNFSSDIDIIFFYTSDDGETAGVSDGSGGRRGVIPLHAFFVKQAEMIVRSLNQVTEDGFVFRVDTALRPEGKSGDLAVSLRSAEVYYESWGQSWERAALLKARPVAGSIPLGEELLRRLEPFIYRKYLDYNLVEDMMLMKKKIDASLARTREGNDNIKLGWGGIREIEFFIQALQLVYAGKHPSLRERNSLRALQLLKSAHIINDDDYRALTDAYRFLRNVEHRIQVVQERQTHNLPRKDEEFRALARRCGYLRPGGDGLFRGELEAHRRRVSEIYASLFRTTELDDRGDVESEILSLLDPGADPDLVKDMLAERRFRDPDAAYDRLVIFREGPPRANLTQRSRRLFERIAPRFLKAVCESPDPDRALAVTETFFQSIGGRSAQLALCAENPGVIDGVVSLFATSAYLSKIFINHPETLEALVTTSHDAAFRDRETIGDELVGVLSTAADFEERLDTLRRFRNQEFLRIGIHDLKGELGQSEISRQLTSVAEVLLDAAVEMARRELSRYGTPRWRDPSGEPRAAELGVIGMGKLGGRELSYHSDLDIIFIYDHPGETDGERPLTNHEYFAKLAQKIIMILTTLTREGYVYKIDTRLRPSGNAGPLVTSLGSFREYHRREAQLWERQALTKARLIYGAPSIEEGVSTILHHAVYGTGVTPDDHREIDRLRNRMEVEIARESGGSYNIKTGRGGMVDVEFIVQYLQLAHGHRMPELRTPNTIEALKAIKGKGLLADDAWEILLNGYKFLRRLETRLRIIHDTSMSDLGGSDDYLDTLARHLGYDPKLRHPGRRLREEYEAITTAIRGVYDGVFRRDSSP